MVQEGNTTKKTKVCLRLSFICGTSPQNVYSFQLDSSLTPSHSYIFCLAFTDFHSSSHQSRPKLLQALFHLFLFSLQITTSSGPSQSTRTHLSTSGSQCNNKVFTSDVWSYPTSTLDSSVRTNARLTTASLSLQRFYSSLTHLLTTPDFLIESVTSYLSTLHFISLDPQCNSFWPSLCISDNTIKANVASVDLSLNETRLLSKVATDFGNTLYNTFPEKLVRRIYKYSKLETFHWNYGN